MQNTEDESVSRWMPIKHFGEHEFQTNVAAEKQGPET